MLKIRDYVDHVEVVAPAVPAQPGRWYILRVHPLCELRVQDKLTARGANCYAPRYPKQMTIPRRFTWQRPIVQRRMVPLFPGIVFVPDFDADLARLKALSDGVAGFLHFGDRIASLSSQLMADVMGIEESLCLPLAQKKQVTRGLAVGMRVRIRDGSPFEMWTGRIERLDGRGRLRVLIDGIKREVAVEMSSHQVEPVEPATVG